MSTHFITGVEITGTAQSPQEIAYADLTDIEGTALEAEYDEAPVVGIVGFDADRKCYLTAAPGVSSFTIALSDIGLQVGSVTITLKIITAEVAATVYGYDTTNIQIMCGKLGVLLNDLADRDFPILLKVDMLNTGQERMMEKLTQNGIWTPSILFLKTPASAQALDANGGLDLAALDTIPWHGPQGLHPDLGVKITGGKHAKLMSAFQYRKALFKSFSFSASDPRYRVEGRYIYIHPFATGDTLDLIYLRAPATMVWGATKTHCEFTGTMKDIILGLACEEFVDRTPFAAQAFAKASELIQDERTAMPQTRSMEDGYDFLGPDGGVDQDFTYDTSGITPG